MCSGFLIILLFVQVVLSIFRRLILDTTAIPGFQNLACESPDWARLSTMRQCQLTRSQFFVTPRPCDLLCCPCHLETLWSLSTFNCLVLSSLEEEVNNKSYSFHINTKATIHCFRQHLLEGLELLGVGVGRSHMIAAYDLQIYLKRLNFFFFPQGKFLCHMV